MAVRRPRADPSAEGVDPKPSLAKLAQAAQRVVVAQRFSRKRVTSVIIPGVSLDDDGKKSDDGVEQKDQTSAAISFFGSERTPAALMAGPAIGIMFAWPLKHGGTDDHAFLKHAYIILAAMSFCNSLVTVFTSSLAITRLMGGSHDGVARDPLVMMLREYPLFFLSVRAHFLTGVLTFGFAISLRLYGETVGETPLLARALLCLMGSCLAFMTSIYNMTLSHFDSFGALWLVYAKLVLERLVMGRRHVLNVKRAGALGILSIVLLVVAAADLARVLVHYVVH
jgi:hypothetical protein